MKSIVELFGLSQDGTRASVVTFSYFVEHSIKFNEHYNVTSFNEAVDAIPLMGSVTRIDKALRITQRRMFMKANGGRSGVSKLLILLTDGTQTISSRAEDPAVVAEELRQSGINLIVVGMGHGVNRPELEKIAGSAAMTYTVGTFSDLFTDSFKGNFEDKVCEGECLHEF